MQLSVKFRLPDQYLMYNVKIHMDDPQQFHVHVQLVLREEDWKERVIDTPQQLLQ
jgi:hypothetical protein